MLFGPIPSAQAAGAILAHSVRAGERLLKKGRLLSPEDVDVLARAGIGEIVVARLEAGDVPEDLAAARVAAAIAGPDVRIGAAFTGRANLFAETEGLARFDAAAIDAINGLDESVTIATLPPFVPVSARQMLATVKVIPFAAPLAAVEAIERIAVRQPVVSVAAFKARRVALISTVLAETRTSLLDKSRSALDQRLVPLGSKIILEERVAHEVPDISRAIKVAQAAGADPIFVFGASAITDRRDAIPAAIEAAGGVVEHFGMPVDPGNLLLTGRIGATRVVGLPSCARSPKVNGFDFVLWRLLAGLDVSGKDLAGMGVGGLLSEIHTRPQPRDRRMQSSGSHAPEIGAVILAAGLSSRMGRNKLIEPVDGAPLIRKVAEAALASAARPVIVVTGSASTEVGAALAGLPVRTVENPDFQKGLSTSLIAGINALPEESEGAVVLLGDMPEVPAAIIDKLIAAFSPDEERAICVATHRGKRGNPVLWSRQFFPEIRKIHGDVGARALMGENAELVCEVEVDDDGPLLDLDTPEALAAYRGRKR